ncbi:beta-mannosidase [Pontiella sulfatireligans]|uniref:Beta-mannosidase B n=1 Tax=Pontiella sulfatireligans TaxID=2750658 RepID=A0A6C2UH63_9BACT|nr:glycoside hydrolase family 2 protein [Pontiella sulfatireligans]VGO19552.1 Exo-beta-D-glucosaminidase [Pontiella sulfatireligans]
MKKHPKNNLIKLFILCQMALAGTGCVHTGSVEEELHENWSFRHFGTAKWYPATVPGCNHTDLLANGIIKDPFWRLNEAELQWIDKLDWEYKTSFSVTPALLKHDRVELDFEGLDTYADVYLNGTNILSADNMFRNWQVNVKNQLKPGANELYILFRSPVVEGIKKHDELDYILPVSKNDLAEHGQVPGGKQVSVFNRKALYHFGWDWGPRLVSSGIWRPVKLKAWNQSRIKDLRIIQNSQSEERAQLTAVFEIEAETATEADLAVRVDDGQVAEISVQLNPGINTCRLDFEIQNPELWWCAGLGEPHLYDIAGTLTQGQRVDRKSHRTGIRTVKLVREKDDMGTSFFFEVNGIPVFMKGANYIPNDILPTRVSDAKYRKVIQTAVDSNFNMLRVWGGGFYENDIFYDLCDENGILVWQDFMFACAMFPGDEAFLENVRQEAIDNVKRLRNHPSIAMWCGNNEMLTALGWAEWQLTKNGLGGSDPEGAWAAVSNGYERIFHDILPNVIEAEDPGRFYWSSSPSAGPGVNARKVGLEHGDEHYWGVWHQKKPYETYSTHIARFMSEYGFQSFPELRTIKEFALPEDYGLLTEVMKHHQRSPVGNEAIDHYLLQSYRKTKDFDSFLHVGQVLQAELIKYAVEAHRRAMPFCMGTLYWQLNDCWPVASWSSMDSSLRWKAQQYFMKKAFEPMLISPFEKEGILDIHIVSDKLQPLPGTLRLKVMDFNGKLLWTKTLDATVPANTSTVMYSIPREEILEGIDDTQAVLLAEWVEEGAVQADALYYFRRVKDLELPEATVTHKIKSVSDGFEITLKTDQLAKNVYLTIGDEDGFFSDNYFDLLPGTEVSVHLKTDCSAGVLKQVLQSNAIADTF